MVLVEQVNYFGDQLVLLHFLTDLGLLLDYLLLVGTVFANCPALALAEDQEYCPQGFVAVAHDVPVAE